jgi:putative ABC transport system permease protein
MFEHALKLIWNRRRANLLVIVEVAAAFVVVFVVVALALRAWSNYQRPLGFTYENVWRVVIVNEAVVRAPGRSQEGMHETTDDVLSALRRLPGVEAAHAIRSTPFTDAVWVTPMGRADSIVKAHQSIMDAGAPATLGIRVVAGRSFGPQDEGQDYIPALVTRVFVERAFGSENPLGARINHIKATDLARLPPEIAAVAAREVRVVGVIDDFRQYGEFSDAEPLVIQRLDPNAGSTQLFVKVAPGTQRTFEERIIATVAAAAPGWRAVLVTPWEQLRATMHQETLRPLRMGATLGAFLLAMVALGLIGIVWQDVVRRTQEIGLRRAAGASAARVRSQIVLETVIVGVFGVAIGTAIAAQFPLLALVARIDWTMALPALVVSAAIILALAALAALYPAWLAARREPADALRYE